MEPRDYSNGLEDVFQCAVFRDLASDSQLGNSSSGDGGRLQVRVSQCQMTVTSQGFISLPYIRDRPSGLLPSDLDRPLGSLELECRLTQMHARPAHNYPMVSCRSARSSFANEAMYNFRMLLYLFSIVTLMMK